MKMFHCTGIIFFSLHRALFANCSTRFFFFLRLLTLCKTKSCFATFFLLSIANFCLQIEFWVRFCRQVSLHSFSPALSTEKISFILNYSQCIVTCNAHIFHWIFSLKNLISSDVSVCCCVAMTNGRVTNKFCNLSEATDIF